MKRTNALTKLISLALFLFLAVYFGVYLVRSMQNPLQTAPAVTVQVEDGFFAPGILVREEQVVHVNQPITASLVREGERVSVGMAYLRAYANEGDRERNVRRAQLEYEITRLEGELSAGSQQAGAGTEAEIRRQIREISYATRRGNLENLETQTVNLRAQSLAGDPAALRDRLALLRTMLSDLGNMSAPAQTIAAERAGVYSTRVDGFEYLGRQDLADMDVAEFRALLNHRYPADTIDRGVGKLITGSTWYYAALVPEAEARRLQRLLDREVPNRVTVSFAGISTSEVPMWVHALSEVENGYAKAVFAANTALVETLGLRHVEARIIYNTFSGIRVPREALHRAAPHEETGVQPTYVFTLTVGLAEQKFVIVVYEGADFYLVRPDTVRTSVDASLREGNTIIVRGRDLHAGGRVVGR